MELESPKTKVSEKEIAENIEKIIIGLGKEGASPAEIGMILKEKYDVDKFRVLGKRIAKILEENNIKYKLDLDFVNEKISKIEKHYAKNKQDKRAKREIVRFIGLRRKIEKYMSKK